MERQTRTGHQFAKVIGKKASDIVLPAMPIEIFYRGVERDYSLEATDGEQFFVMRIPETFTPEWDLGTVWDAYNLRETFEKLRDPKDAWNWLNVVGPFRCKRRRSEREQVLTWHELQGWQEIIRCLRLRDTSEWFPDLGSQSRDLKSLFLGSEFIAEFSDFAEQIWTVSEETFWWLQGIPQALSIRRDMYLSRREIEEIFSSPGARVRGSREWHHAQSALGRRRAERARGNTEGKQKLLAEVAAATALDAILATVYVDKLRGIEFQVCALRECNESFERASDYGKIYCSNYHAHLASVRRKRAAAKAKKAVQLDVKEKTK